jgi:myo-inositol-1(or 4)-monophosphatase
MDDLRAIGVKLMEMSAGLRFSGRAGEFITVGASGDDTLLIDKTAEDIILAHLGSLGEFFHIVSEECGVVGDGPVRIIIDPIDGSKNAVNGVPMFSTSIAAARGATLADIHMGYVINLSSGDEFTAEKDAGAFLNGRPIAASKLEDIGIIIYETQNPAVDIPAIMPLINVCRRARCFGSTALDLAHLAGGAASLVAIAYATRPIDFAAGYLLVKEAGGIVTDFSGNDISCSLSGIERTTTLLAAANPQVHFKAVALLNGG